jgi:hypothetical protein
MTKSNPEQAINHLIARMQASGFLPVDGPESKELARRIVLGIPARLPAEKSLQNILDADYEAGTFTLAERKGSPPYISVVEEESYEDWIRREAAEDMDRLVTCLNKHLPWLTTPVVYREELMDTVLNCLEYGFTGEAKLCEQVYQQGYTDVFRRINLTFLTGWPRLPITEYDAVNSVMFNLGMQLAEKCQALDLSVLMRVTAASGLVGLNHKHNASATSVLHPAGIRGVELEEKSEQASARVFSELVKRADEGWAIDCEREFWPMVLEGERSRNLVFFTDDYLETILDLKLIERMLQTNPFLRVHLVPRATRVGNDAGYCDIQIFLHTTTFEKLHSYEMAGRLSVESMGPLSGYVNALYLAAPVVDRMNRADCAVIKGARSFESLQGIKKDAFFAFAVCRGLSESVTGINAETGGLVLIHQRPGGKSFAGFRQRHQRCVKTPSGRKMWLAERTVLDTVEQS